MRWYGRTFAFRKSLHPHDHAMPSRDAPNWSLREQRVGGDLVRPAVSARTPGREMPATAIG
jgi:hypothetical protein